MKKYTYLALSLLLVGTLVKASNQAKPETKTRSLSVKLDYKGSGTVDEKHRIFVFVFDSPDFVKGESLPIAVDAATSKDGAVSFPDLSDSPVYVASAYDPSGSYDGHSGPPPTGTSMGLYSKTPGKPEPVDVEPGKAVTIDLVFDDTAKIP